MEGISGVKKKRFQQKYDVAIEQHIEAMAYSYQDNVKCSGFDLKLELKHKTLARRGLAEEKAALELRTSRSGRKQGST